MKSSLGQELYDRLPEIYRTRDNAQRVEGKILQEGDLARYLDACGHLLDLLAATLHQRLKDTSPKECQDWLLPYFAALVGGRIRSRDPAAQREEVGKAIAWRQSKGTRACVASLATAMTRSPAVIQEGWTRVLRTARVGQPVLSALEYGGAEEITLRSPAQDVDMQRAASHPGLAMGTVDFRQASRAVEAAAGGPRASALMVNGRTVWWRPANGHGKPCHPGSFDDYSARIVDLRSPNQRAGHFHPRKLLVFLPLPIGRFDHGQTALPWAQTGAPAAASFIRIEAGPETVRYVGLTAQPLRLTGPVELDDGRTHCFENVAFADPVQVAQGRVSARRSGFVALTAKASDLDEPTLDLSDTLVGTLLAPNSLVRLSGCTVLTGVSVGRIQATDCVFPDAFTLFGGDVARPSCLRFSRVPELVLALTPSPSSVLTYRCTRLLPIYQEPPAGPAGALPLDPGVLHPATPDAIAFGAEDGGEMGAYHADQHRGRIHALLAKLAEFLPVGIQPAVVEDPFLCSVSIPKVRSLDDRS